ncbi:PAS domain-containing sensor histidine kinase [Caulobacter sp. 17J80-11]|uniref:PAS domain-containing sensor histidine kinase n=1 Tax=Caulobacter sp. 17J80-11 TaxID=2763502 RepID=UPI0016536B25|nr:PAS domain-containing sensor histidine kinase [Caulobacter sp. 17J80-11]MBC6981551.1 PAS-domain containing protein [Caulobacter sp. 17J80-11]
MAASDIAFAAAAGATALALSTTLWTWRFRRRAEARAGDLEARLAAVQAALSEAEAATAAFEGALVAVEGEEARLVWGDEALETAAAALEVEADSASVLQAVARIAPEYGVKLRTLLERGEPCRFLVQTSRGALVVEGRPSGAIAWVRITPAGDAVPGGKFAGLADRLPNPAWITDGRGALVWANRAWLEAAEATSLDDARARNATFDRGADALLSEAFQLRARREGFRWVTVGGQRRAYRVAAEPVGEDEVAAFAIDVTEAEETREALRRHVAAHDETLNHLADAVAIFGPEKRLSYHNTAFQELWALEAGWLAERPTHGELLDRLRQRRRLPETVEYTKWKAAELEFYGSTAVAPDDLWSLPDGRTLRVVRQPHPMGGLLLLFSDITGELKLRAQYNALIQVQKATLDKLNDAVAVFGSDGRLRLHNEAFERFWNVTGEQIGEAGDFDRVAELCRPLLHDAALWTELKGKVADTDPRARAPMTGEARTSDRRVVAYQSRPLPDGATLIGFDDVTATKELVRALEQRSAALVEAERLKRDFVGNVSYELRTPLTTIVGYSELLEAQGQALPDRARNHLGAIKTAAAQLARSIDDVLDMAQIDAGEMALAIEDVAVCDALEAAAQRVRAEIEGRGGALVVSCAADAGTIRADARRLGQALDHLLDNAARATAAGGVVTLAAERTASGVQLTVRDTGRGIPYHQQAHVFDRFVGRDRGGPGLGLALVKALVELHGGWVALQSEPGAGATFTMHLPEQAVMERDAAE